MPFPQLDTRNHGSASGADVTVAVTVGANSNLYLLLMCFHTSNTALTITDNGSSAGISTILTGTYNGNVGMCEIRAVLAPSTGSHSVVFSTANQDSLFCYVISLYNVDQVTPNHNVTQNNSNGSTPQTISVASDPTDLVIAVGVGVFGESSLTFNSGTNPWDTDSQGGGPTWGADGWVDGTGSPVTIGWNTGNAGDAWTVAGLAIRLSSLPPVESWMPPVAQPMPRISEMVAY